MRISDKVDTLAQTLDSLIEKAELWQLLFDESPDAIAVFDHKFRFFMINKEFQALTSFASEELIGSKIDVVLPRRLRRMHKGWEKEYAANPEKKVNRHGLEPYITDKYGYEIAVGIDLSFFEHGGRTYYTAFVRRR